VPETITSDRWLQFISNIWSLLCEMLQILHRQTTAYHPESNGAVERLPHHLKDALRARATAATWAEELPIVLLGLCAQRGKTLVFPWLRQFLALQLSCPTNFYMSIGGISGKRKCGLWGRMLEGYCSS
jgi:hypothetical protein